MILDPLATSDDIVATYQRYLRSLVEPRDPRLAAALDTAIADAISQEITKGPLLEATPPYRTGRTPRQLIDAGALHPGVAALGAGLALDRPLYRHQERAIGKVRAGRNVVVATGTGSGKTESFLLPILDRLMAQRAAGTLGPGVRALLLYPMNALANDQMKRLRTLLAGAPDITFGRYTGETRHTLREAAEVFAHQHPGEQRLPNELLSREQMQATPPHLLLTNYAMLEYLLLRPLDMDLFEGDHAGHWQFIVVDEAHVYDGARGAELAMLLRRLVDRVGQGRSVQCIATSATVGGDLAAVADFASSLFPVPFQHDPADAAAQDVITAERVEVPAGPEWGPLPAAAYRQLREAPSPAAALLEHARRDGVPAMSDVPAASAVPVGSADDAAAAVLEQEQRVRRLKRLLSHGPMPLREVAKALFPDADQAAVTDLVALANAVHDSTGTPVLSARYHLFARATEGAFACLGANGPHVSLTRHERCTHCGDAAFEIGTCRRCGTEHLAGTVERVGSTAVFRSRRSRDEQQTWLALVDDVTTDEDEETLQTNSVAKASETGALCARCGVFQVGPAGNCPQCPGGPMRTVRFVRQNAEALTSCVGCGGRGDGLIRLFASGNEASASVLATALYQRLPQATDAAQQARPGGGRKVLLFSDSRQSAAYFAPYLEDSYQRVQRRRLLREGALAAAARGDAEIRLDDVVHDTARAADRYGIFQRRDSAQARRRQVALWAQTEIVGVDERNSLEGRGLLAWGMSRDPAWQAPQPLISLGLTETEVWALLDELLRSVRLQGAVAAPDGVDPRDEAFAPRVGPIYLRGTGSDARRKVLSWLPTSGTNRRVDYLRRVLARLGVTADPHQLLDGIWRLLTVGPMSELLRPSLEPGIGQVYQLDHELITCTVPGDDHPVWQCGTCRRITPYTVRGVCPTMKCVGELTRWVPPPADVDHDHYRSVYREMNPVPMRVLEHTAQWTSEQAAFIQQQFVEGKVNALSCSTTFELGVDVGELQAVMLRNMPPTTANYVQRAGRAGRRTDSAALVLTYAQRRSHDLSRFAEPDRMIAGEVRAPYVPLTNVRIDRRHAHSVALAAFFRHHFRTYGTIWRTAGEFLLASDDGVAPVTLVAGFLDPVPAEIVESLDRVLPAEVRDEIGVASGDWVTHLVGLLESVRAELQNDVDIYEEKRAEAFAARKDDSAARFGRVMKTITGRELLGLLANRNVLPKYGFPVDTVELRLTFADDQMSRQLELSRDLSSAIYEYAPGAEVVAGGQTWQSAGVYRLPGRDLERRHYAVCAGCGHYRDSIERLDPQCPACGAPATGVPRQYAVPVFGFVADRSGGRRPSTAPRRTWHGATHVVSTGAEIFEDKVDLPGGSVTVRAGSRGELIAISDGSGGAGYLICDRCGFAQSNTSKKQRQHSSPLTGRDCRGRLELLSLAHKYQTDVLDLSVDSAALGGIDDNGWRSLAYAVVEGAVQALEISRDDIDATVYRTEANRSVIMLYDTVPGGAGHVQRIAARVRDVLDEALRRVRDCECGVETSCYRCLRVFRNDRYHEHLRRGVAADVLGRLLGRDDQTPLGALRVTLAEHAAAVDADRRFLIDDVPGEVFEPVTPGQLDLYEGRIVFARRAGAAAVGRLWLRRDGENGDIVGAGVEPLAGEPLDGLDDLSLIGVALL
ncbi:DEAD/DEAH box helicase [Solwaraspora sp. WMMA2080]|uniref:DEAD/DEAH box helicase n=1 Tax=unclassified Solwaraspora TaxID=2627926 RepID=UPI00248C8D3F|nr:MULTISPECIES: DEAD/DEAH box helicase [unclassified Solwaraspora]WBB99736.1 DEAD/DEAH box helicase [Solwaraspora sp. WMMA2059]WBC21714.1 DEAD/DEAH box helicase [Solwaraspora sp. WMMA2080]